ncbi:MAG: substrate-binding domain-containing protein, partial [Verrucomicrobiota bacterium]
MKVDPPSHGLRIGVVTNIQHAYGRKSYRGIYDCICKNRPDAQLDLLLHRDNYPLEITNRFDGLLTTINPPDLKHIDSNTPIIRLSGLQKTRYSGSFNVDNRSIGLIAAEALFNHGVICFGYFDGYYRKNQQTNNNSRSRLDGYQKGIIRLTRGSVARTAIVCHSKNRSELMQWISELPKPAGIFAFNDLRALELSECCESLSIRVPEDVAIIGVDDDQNFCHLSCPPLSSIDPNISAIAYNATSRLLQLIDQKPNSSEIPQDAQPFLVARESTGQRSCSDPLVQRVIGIFEKHAIQRPSLSHIASELGFSLRALETAFQEKCGITLKDEFLRIQLNEFRRLLRITDQTIEEMAHQLGWQASALQSAFRRVTGYAPGQYRKLFRSTTPAAL